MTEREPWLGHRDWCSLQWSDECDCPNGAEYLAEQDTCRPVEVDGEIIRVHGGAEMDETDRMHFAELVRAVKRRMEAEEEASDG